MAQLVSDGQTSFEGGQDSSLPPSRLPENRFSKGVNVTTSQGTLRPRYGYERKTLKLPAGGYVPTYNVQYDYRDIFTSGKFQAFAPYKIGERSYAVAVISGVIFLINLSTYEVNVLTHGKDTQLDESADRINWSEAGRFLVLYDFPSKPIIIDGQVAHRASNDLDELPASTLGVFNQSRLFFSNFGNEFSAGDPVGNPLTPQAPVTVLEITLSGSDFYGDVYQLPSKKNLPITAMATLQNTDKSTGIGQLIVATRNEIWTYLTNTPRAQWIGDTSKSYGQFGSELTDKAGIVGARALVNVQSDVFFISADGQLRTLSMSTREQGKWAKVPMNVEVSSWVSYLSPELMKYSTLTFFKNKIFWTVRPYRILSSRLNGKPVLDVAHSGFVVLETDNISRMGQDASPAWAGLWTGIRPMDAIVIDERMFVMSKDYYSRNALYEVDPELHYDRTQEGQRRRIKGTVYTREHFFQDLFAIKNLQNIELGVSEIQGKFEIDIDWKPSHSANFLFWTHFEHLVPVEYRAISQDIPERLPVAFRELRFGIPDTQDGHPITKDLYDRVKRVQFRISLTGDHWQLNEYRVTANVVQDSKTEFLQDLPIESELKVPHSDWTYEEFGLGPPEAA